MVYSLQWCTQSNVVLTPMVYSFQWCTYSFQWCTHSNGVLIPKVYSFQWCTHSIGVLEPCMLYIFLYNVAISVAMDAIQTNCVTVEPLLKDSPNKGHHINYLSTKDTFRGTKNRLSYSGNTFFTSEEWTTSLQWTNLLVPMCPL